METRMTWQLPGGAIVSLTFSADAPTPTPAQFESIRAYLEIWAGNAGQTVQQLAALQQGVEAMSANLDAIKTAIGALQADVAAQQTVTASVITLIDGLKAQISEALQADLALPDLTAQLEGINTELDAARDQLAAAVSTNTPVEPSPIADPVADSEPAPEG